MKLNIFEVGMFERRNSSQPHPVLTVCHVVAPLQAQAGWAWAGAAPCGCCVARAEGLFLRATESF